MSMRCSETPLRANSRHMQRSKFGAFRDLSRERLLQTPSVRTWFVMLLWANLPTN